MKKISQEDKDIDIRNTFLENFRVAKNKGIDSQSEVILKNYESDKEEIDMFCIKAFGYSLTTMLAMAKENEISLIEELYYSMETDDEPFRKVGRTLRLGAKENKIKEILAVLVGGEDLLKDTIGEAKDVKKRTRNANRV